MFQSTQLANHLATSDTIKTESAVYAEWNMNQPDNIERVGNYRYRPTYSGSQYYLIPMSYDPSDVGEYYTGATDSDIVIDSGFNDFDSPSLFLENKDKFKLFYSLDDCIKPYRPRSGINKMLYLNNTGTQKQYITNPPPINAVNQAIQNSSKTSITNRPRYYLASKEDLFKYWTSYRTEYGMPTPRPGQAIAQVLRQVDRGISFALDGINYIEDAAPFFVYKESVPTNKIVIKMQTNVGDVNLGNVRVGNQEIPDPLYVGNNTQTTPVVWRIEKLTSDNSWETIISFDENSLRSNNEPLIGADGYLEISYGLNIPEKYKSNFVFAGKIANTTLLPDAAPAGYAYLVQQNETDIGTFYVSVSDGITYDYESFVPEYAWQISEEPININSNFVTKITDPEYYISQGGETVYREFEFIDGIRLVVKTMNKPSCTFDLIEVSPRLTVDLTEMVSSFSMTKTMSDLGNGSIPVGSLNASIGQIEIFDSDFAFNENNSFDFSTKTGSILAQYTEIPVKFLFYEITKEVDGIDYFIPVKTMYSDSFPQAAGNAGVISIELRDFYLFLESMPAPELLLTDISLSWAISILLDNIGFSNYSFKRIDNYPEPVIPYFFVEPNQNCAEVLQKLAVASQSAMFFDEYNNLVIMSKEYLLPSNEEERATDFTLYGQQEDSYLPNIVSLSSEEKKIYNSGQINYTTRYIQRSIGSTKTAQTLDEYKNYIYRPVLLWEVPGRESTKSINEIGAQNSGYTLSAIPLSTKLTSELPYARNNILYNNIINVGENVYWIASYNGYFYANGEIIRYDAIEYSISGQALPVWITNNQEYQDYFGKLPFNGKMYPTGNVRIYTNPEYQEINGIFTIKDGIVKEHGRGQFGTQITEHTAGLIDDNYWTNNSYVRGCFQDSAKYLFTTSDYVVYPTNLVGGIAGEYSGYITDQEGYKATSSASVQIKNSGVVTIPIQTNKLFLQGDTIIARGYTSASAAQSNVQITQARNMMIGPISSYDKTTGSLVFEVKEAYDAGTTLPYWVISFTGKTGNNIVIENTTINANILAAQSSRNGVIKNFLSEKYLTEQEVNYMKTTSPGTVQSSALVFNGPSIPFYLNASDFVSYIYKDFTDPNTGSAAPYKHFGTRMRIIGKIESSSNTSQTPIGAYPIYQGSAGSSSGLFFEYGATSPLSQNSPNQAVKIYGGSGGIGIGVNKETNNGYFLEIVGLTSDNVNQYANNNTANTITYKILASPVPTCVNNEVTVHTEIQHNLQVGQPVTIIGLIDSNDPSNTRTALNGQYIVTAVNVDKKSFKYKISQSPALSTTVSVDTNTAKVIQEGAQRTSIANIFFYKVLADPSNKKAVPYRLWRGLAQINLDSGDFIGQNRLAGENATTVYDLAAEYVNIGSTRRFFLYLNGKQIATVDDTNPLPEYNSMAVFVRGSSKCMFENVYALGKNYSNNTEFSVNTGIASIFGDEEIDASEALRKYAMSGIIRKTFLSGIKSEDGSSYRMYFDEFGTILRECAYFNIKYDRAYPALYARLMKTLNNFKGYTTSGFLAGPYGAEFLVFNSTDFNLNLDDTSGNYLRIQGVAFTQDTTYNLTVDDYFKKKSIIDPSEISNSQTITNPNKVLQEYNRIKNSRIKYGVNEFTPIESPYIQTTADAEKIFGWVIDKVSVPKKLVGVKTFATSNAQLGDIVNINYKYDQGDGISLISPEDKRFVIYNIEYTKNIEGPQTLIYLAEV